ncbi:hypothetical protein PG999_003996 [Apiospora kogelbergensis]|uniref:Rhodopsin domain-containing protein n=1 Tax=Apiospora kogelbergensis TaxID=1337665 RepID=A0AAW0R509_9PEZI
MALPPPPPGLDLSESRTTEINGTLIGMFSLATVTISLRMFSRRLKGNPIWVEDWLALVGWIAQGVHCLVSVLYMVPNGTGRHVWAGPPIAVKTWAIGLFISEICYTITIATIKWSTLCFYWRIFSARRSIRIPIWILAGIVGMWATAVILVTILQCIPIHAFWQRYDPFNPMDPKQFRCGVELSPFFNGNSIPNIVTDSFVVLLPLPYVWQLQLRRSQRIAVGGIFALGAFVTIVSIVRLKLILNVDLLSADITWNFNDTIIWTNIETNTAIICACLPALKPLLTLALKGTLKSSAGGGSNTAPGSGYMKGSGVHQSKSMKGSNALGTFSGARATRAPSVGVHIAKGSLVSDDDRPFVRLQETDGNDVELRSMDHKHKTGGITVTREFGAGDRDSHAARRGDNNV